MNKSFVVALLVVAACQFVSAISSDDINDKEVGLLLGNEQLFAPSCMKTRDEIVQDLNQRGRDAQSFVFNLFFQAASEIADETLSVQKEVVEKLSTSLSNPEQEPIVDGPLAENKVLELIEEGKEEVQKKGMIGRFVEATKSASLAIIGTANSALFRRLAKARSQMNPRNLLDGILYTCGQVDMYKVKLDDDLDQAKVAIKAEVDEPELQKFVDSMTSSDLKCTTYKFINRLNFFCHVFRDGGNFFLKMLNLPYEIPKPTPKSA